MKGVNTRLVQAFLVVVILVIGTNFNYIFGNKKTVEAETAPGPAPGPAPETPEEEEETPVTQPLEGVKTAVTTELQMITTLPPGIVKKEGYIGYSHI